MFKAIIATAAVAATFNAALACTAVDMVAADGSVIAGRTMEWAFDMQWTLVSLPKGTPLAMTATPALKLPTVTLTSKYAIVGVKPGIIPGDALLEGQNSAGLGMSGNFLPGFTEYQTVAPQDKSYVSVLGFGAWALGQFATVGELRQALPGIKVWADDTLPSGQTPLTLHFSFTDKSGASIVVEFVNGQQRIFDNVARVLTNAPTYDWHLSNIRNYLNLSTIASTSMPDQGNQRHGTRSGRRQHRHSWRLHAAVALRARRLHAPLRDKAQERGRGDTADRPHPQHGRHSARHCPIEGGQ